MILAIDAGNTRIKAAVFEGTHLVQSFIFVYADFKNTVINILKNYKEIRAMIVASVSTVSKDDFIGFTSLLPIHFVSHKDIFPFVNTYETPETLGIDRLVLATGATLQFPKQNRLVIDAGTCVTLDFIDNNDFYLGGAISPGLRLRYESLHQHTAKLPLLTNQHPTNLFGTSTTSAIHSGVVHGLTFEIDAYISNLSVKYPKFIIILTGGDAVFLAKQLKNTIFANSNFLLESLNQLFLYKSNND
jgi:type III pantothenate kinase